MHDVSFSAVFARSGMALPWRVGRRQGLLPVNMVSTTPARGVAPLPPRGVAPALKTGDFIVSCLMVGPL